MSTTAPESDARLADLIAEIRGLADRFVFLVGGASEMDAERYRLAVAMLRRIRHRSALDGYRLAVGDGGTKAGIMEAAGLARRRSGNRFPLVGVAPAIDVPPRGSTPLDPNHSHIVTVADPSVTAPEAWGTETGIMYWLFGRLSEGRPSVAVLVNGGGVALKEVVANVEAGRPLIVLEGSGRAADAIASLAKGATPAHDVAEFGRDGAGDGRIGAARTASRAPDRWRCHRVEKCDARDHRRGHMATIFVIHDPRDARLHRRDAAEAAAQPRLRSVGVAPPKRMTPTCIATGIRGPSSWWCQQASRQSDAVRRLATHALKAPQPTISVQLDRTEPEQVADGLGAVPAIDPGDEYPDAVPMAMRIREGLPLLLPPVELGRRPRGAARRN